MSTEKNLEKIAKYLSDNMVPEEKEELFAWVEAESENKALFEDSMDVWEAAEPSPDSFRANTDIAWEKMEERMEHKRQQAEVESSLEVVSLLRPMLRIAAAAILLLMAGIWYYDTIEPEPSIVSTQIDEKTTVDLPDGSKVWLNENSTLTYEKVFDNRIVYLQGEAFFEVEKKDGATFEVIAGESKTTVLGTSFNIRAYESEAYVEVAVKTGKVEVTSQKKQSKAILQPAEHAIYTKTTAKVEKQSGPLANADAWKKQELNFSKASMDQIIQDLERYFDIEIEVTNKDILKCGWESTDPRIPNPKLENILKQINFGSPFSVDTVIVNEKYVFSGKGC